VGVLRKSKVFLAFKMAKIQRVSSGLGTPAVRGEDRNNVDGRRRVEKDIHRAYIVDCGDA
jgi:hypothetical protein